MRILFITPYAPSLIRVRPYQLIRSLAKRGNCVTLATLWSSPEEQLGLSKLADCGVEIHSVRLPSWRPLWNCGCAILSRKPFQAAYCWQPVLASELRHLLGANHFDAVHIEHMRGASFGIQVMERIKKQPRGRRPAVVWDSVDCISYLFEQASSQSGSLKGRCMTALELRSTRRYEGWLLGQFDHVLVTSETDKAALLSLAGSTEPGAEGPAPVSVLPNGVDLGYFRPSGGQRENTTLVFSGKMNYHANMTAVRYLLRKVMPRVWAERPEVQVIIVGKDPSRDLQTLAGKNDRIIVTGEVPDIRPYLRRATVAVAPIVYGAGIQNKVLEAMACGTPVIASSRALSALKAEAGSQVFSADNPDDFSERILLLLNRPDLQEKLSAGGLQYVRQYHDWGKVCGQLEQTYESAQEQRAGTRSAA